MEKIRVALHARETEKKWENFGEGSPTFFFKSLLPVLFLLILERCPQKQYAITGGICVCMYISAGICVCAHIIFIFLILRDCVCVRLK